MKKANKKNWKPEYKYETLTGTFIDYCGNERDFTMVAVSVPVTDLDVTKMVKKEIVYDNFKISSFLAEDVCKIAKYLTIGVAVRSVSDKADPELAERIAYGKALALQNHTMYVSHPGMINTKMVTALLEQEASYFVKDPGSYIKGYNDDRDRYNKTGRIATAEMPEAKSEGTNNKYNQVYHDVSRKPIKFD